MNDILAGLECQHATNASSVTLSSGSATSSLFLDSTGDEHHLRPGGYCFLHNNTHHSSDDLSTCNEWENHQKTRHISKIVEYFEEKQSQRETQPSIRPRRSGLVSGVLRRATNTTSPNVCGKRILVCEGAVRSKLKLFDPDIIKCIMIKDFNHFTDRQTMRFRTSEYITEMLINLKGSKWKRMRGQLTPAFTSGKLRTMEHLVDVCCNNMSDFLNENIKSEQGYDLEMKDFFGKFTLDVIATCAFGVESNSLKDVNGGFASRVSKFASLSIMKRLSLYIVLLFMPGIARFVPLSFFNMEVIQFLANVIKDAKKFRQSTGQKRNDFLQLLLDSETDSDKNDKTKSKEDALTEAQVVAQSVLFLIAGFETSSTLLTFTCYEMAINQTIQANLRKEICSVLERYNGKCTYEAMQEMPLLDMVLMETLRMHPPVAQLERVSTQDYMLPDSNLLLKKGMTVQIPVIGLHYDPEYYPEPYKFEPNRFSPEEKAKRSHYVFLPFGTGPRNCIGLRFALMSTKRGMVHLLKDFSIDLSNQMTVPYEYSKHSMLLKAKDGIRLSFNKLSA